MMKKNLYFLLTLILLIQISCKNYTQETPMPIEKNIIGDTGIMIVSHHTLDANYLEYSWENHKSYAKKHGYDYWFRNGVIDNKFADPEGKNNIYKNGLYWQKLAAVEQALDIKNSRGEKKYPWVMWIDADAMYTDFDKKIETIIDNLTNNEFFVIAQDFLEICLNTGIWLIKNDDRGRQFLNTVVKAFSYYKANEYPEQHAVQDLVFGYITEAMIDSHQVAKYEPRVCLAQEIIPGVKVLPQRAMNSYYTSYAVDHKNSSWHAKDYIAHVAGGVNKLDLIKRLSLCIKNKGADLQGCEVNGSWQR